MGNNLQINWILCSDRMPPDDEIIFKMYMETMTKYFVLDGSIFNSICDDFVKLDIEWIPYDEATCKGLNEK